MADDSQHRGLAMEALDRLNGTRADLNCVRGYVDRLESMLRRHSALAKEVATLLPNDTAEDDCG